MTRALLLPVLIAVGACNGEPVPREQPRPLAEIAEQCKKPELGCPRPIFPVGNLRSALDYYRNALGFKIDWEWGNPPDFASVSRGDATIFIGLAPRGGGGALWVFARHVDKLHDELRKRGALIKMPPTDMPWGSREMHVVDRDGNLIRFGGPSKR